MPHIQRRHVLRLLSAATLAATSRSSSADEVFPSRPVRIIVPWPPGGGVDALARTIQQTLGTHLGQPVVIENLGGASGRVGAQAAARATPNGYTLLLANDTFAATEALPIGGTTPLRTAFTPVTLIVSGPQGVFTHPRSGLNTIQDLASKARAQPGAVNVGVPGLGSSQHLTSELLFRAAGNLRVEHVPYKGGGPLLLDLVSGVVDAAVVTFAAAAQQARAGQLVPLAVTSTGRASAFPSVPTAAETIAPGFTQSTWIGFFAPHGTPAAAIARIHAATTATLADPAVIERLGNLGFEPSGLDSSAFRTLFDQTVATFARIAAERGIVAGS